MIVDDVQLSNENEGTSLKSCRFMSTLIRFFTQSLGFSPSIIAKSGLVLDVLLRCFDSGYNHCISFGSGVLVDVFNEHFEIYIYCFIVGYANRWLCQRIDVDEVCGG